ncbi:MAG: tandem-95 repeat protein [Desulfobacteraceae bacterium]|nr:tandem-95 repeat protein [Desulfobacteraceae bacterium]
MLTLSASSSNPVLVNSSNIFFSGTGKERNISVFPAENESGKATIRVTVRDIAGKTADTDFILTVYPVNDKPTVENSSFTTDEDIEFTGTLSSDDADGDTLTFIIVEHAQKGLVKISQTGEFTYTPNENKNGTDTFTFKVSDGQIDSDTASVTITVNPVNDPPVADAGQDQDVACGTSVSLDGSSSFDIDGEITYLWSQINGPTVTLSDPKTVYPVFDSPDTISDENYLEFQLTVTDDQGLESADTVTIYISEITRVGDINGDKNVDLQDVILTLKVLAGISDNDIYIEAEVNGDGKIGTEELIYMLQVISGLSHD